MTQPSTEPDERAVRDHVTRYFVARERWERRAHRDFQAAMANESLSDATDRIESAYGQLADEFFDMNARTRKDSLTFGDPPSVQADSTRIMSIDLSKPGNAIVTTIEKSNGPEGKATHEYRMRKQGGRWGLVDRRVQSDGVWIRQLL